MDTQLVFPNNIPFTENKIDYDNIYIKFLDGDNLNFGDIYCRCKLTDDISWKKTRTIKNCSNPQWYQDVIILPITNICNQVQVEIKNENVVVDTSCSSFTINLDEITTQGTKRINNLSKGTISYLIQRGSNGIIPFIDYVEPMEKILAENVMLAVKVVEAKNLKAADVNSSDPYCVLKLNGVEKKTRVIGSNLNPIWNQFFYFNITSFSTNELSIKIFDKDKLSKDDLLFELNIPINNLKYGEVEDKWYSSLHLITHIVLPGNYSFDSNPFTTTQRLILVENLENRNDIFYKIKLQGDEYYRYTKIGNFKDYFNFEYVNNHNLLMVASDGKNNSSEMIIDLTIDEDKIYNSDFGQFKLSFPKKIMPTNPPVSFWTCNILIKNINNLKKEKNILWMVEINKCNSGFTYDGFINKYITLNINSVQNEIFNVILFRKEGDKKMSQYAKGAFYIAEFELGVSKEKTINLEKDKLLGSNYTDMNILINIHITPPNVEPFFNQRFYPLMMHIYALEALNIPKMDLMSKTDPYVIFRFEKDTIGVRTKYLEDTLTPQWNELVNLIIPDESQDLIVEIWDKNVKVDKMICSTKLSIKEYLDEKPHFEWIKIGKVLINLAIHIKQEGQKFISFEEVDAYQANNIPPNI